MGRGVDFRRAESLDDVEQELTEAERERLREIAEERDADAG
ncbi:hypothetical protein ABZ860_29970 [Microbispora sp. NPDC046973]